MNQELIPFSDLTRLRISILTQNIKSTEIVKVLQKSNGLNTLNVVNFTVIY